jgi:hypothetical protein
MSFLMRRKKGAGVGRVFAFASIANQPHALENKYVPGSGVGVSSISARRALSRRATICRSLPVILPPPPPSTPEIYSKDNITEEEFTVGNESVTKDMANARYTFDLNPKNYPEFFPNMAPFTSANIVAGDKGGNRLLASFWDDLGDDVFDDWGFFYLYDVRSRKYYFPLINPLNGDNGVITTQTFNAFGRTFTIKHGWVVQGIFKFDILAADGLPFRFGAYGNVDAQRFGESLTQNYSIDGENLTLHYYHYYVPSENPNEQLYSYWIPTKIAENSAQTYDVYYGQDGENTRTDDMGMLSKEVTSGLIVYFAKTNNVKEWVINDLGIIS